MPHVPALLRHLFECRALPLLAAAHLHLLSLLKHGQAYATLRAFLHAGTLEVDLFGCRTSVGRELLKEHLSHCVADALENGDRTAMEEFSAAIDKFIK